MRERTWRVPIVLFALATLAPAWAKAEAVRPEPLNIELVSPSAASRNESKAVETSWKSACAALGAAFKIKRNFFFHGIAASHSCRIVSGAGDTRANGWTLRITPGPASWTLAMFYDNTAEPEASLAIAGDAKVIKALGEPEVARHAAMKLMDDLPLARLVDQKSIKSSLSYKGKRNGAQLTPVKEYKIFSMSYLPEGRLWAPRMVGEATLLRSAKTGVWKWRVVLDGPLEPHQTYWAQDARGRGANAVGLSENLKNALSKHDLKGGLLDDAATALYATVSSGYAGFRFGYPILQADPLLSKSAMVGIFTEVRGGPLEGLRWYWDFAPEARATINGEKMNFTWSRASLGWALGLDLDSSFLTRIDLIPKVGLMDLDAKVPFETSRGVVPVKFRFKNATNLGLELGVETASPWFLLRLWGATDVSGYLDLGGPGTIKSLRAGIDTYWDLYEISDRFKLSLLAFGFAEKLSLAKKEGEIDADANVKIQAIGYALGIVGVGLILAW